RRVRAVSPANRSDGFLGSDLSQDDGFFFDGKPEDFEWKVVGHKEALRFVDPDSIAGKVKERELPGGGWRTVAINNDRTVGYMVKDWKGVPWGPVAAAVAKRKFWVLEGVPKDKYYLYGKMELWIDDTTWAGAWNRKFSWRGDLLNTLQVLGYATLAFNAHERRWGATMAFQLAENIKQDRATAPGMNGPGTAPPRARRAPRRPRRPRAARRRGLVLAAQRRHGRLPHVERVRGDARRPRPARQQELHRLGAGPVLRSSRGAGVGELPEPGDPAQVRRQLLRGQRSLTGACRRSGPALAPSGRSTPPVVFPDREGSPPSPLRPSAPVSRGIRLPTVPPEHRRFGVAAPGRLTRPVLFAENGAGWTSA